MKPYIFKRILTIHPSVRRAILAGFDLYESCVWTVFDFKYRLFVRLYPRIERPPETIGSVLHISAMSHKPFMLSRLMRTHGLKSSYLALYPEAGWLKVGRKGYDYAIHFTVLSILFRPIINIYYVWTLLRHYDVIHYHFASYLDPKGHELKYLKRMGKVIVVHFRGCDLRQKSVNMNLNPGLNCCGDCDYPPGTCETPEQLRRIALARRYADLLFVTTPDLLDFLPEAEHVPFVAPFGIDLDAIEASPRSPGVFRVVTSSNHHGVDGTEYVRRAVARLTEEGYAIELVEVHKTPYEQALSIYKSADVYAGKLLMGYYNNAIIECMMLGVPTICYIRDDYLPGIPDCPIIIARPEMVYERLKDAIGNKTELGEIGVKGKAFIQKYHDPDTVVETILNRYGAILEAR